MFGQYMKFYTWFHVVSITGRRWMTWGGRVLWYILSYTLIWSLILYLHLRKFFFIPLIIRILIFTKKISHFWHFNIMGINTSNTWFGKNLWKFTTSKRTILCDTLLVYFLYVISVYDRLFDFIYYEPIIDKSI